MFTKEIKKLEEKIAKQQEKIRIQQEKAILEYNLLNADLAALEKVMSTMQEAMGLQKDENFISTFEKECHEQRGDVLDAMNKYLTDKAPLYPDESDLPA